MISTEHATGAVERMGALKFFPSKSEDIVRDEIAALLIRMVPSVTDLEWLTVAMIDVGQWYGPGELRGVLCSHTEPLDGKLAICTETPGYTAGDLEAHHVKRQMIAGQKQIAAPEPPLSDEERAWIDDFNTKLRAKTAARERPAAKGPAVDPVEYAKWQREQEEKLTEAAKVSAEQTA